MANTEAEITKLIALQEFQDGQWWVQELDGLSGKYPLTDDEKRAVAVVHRLLRTIMFEGK